MNSDLNSDSEHYTESKLIQVYSAPTHGPGCAQAARALGRVVAHARLARRVSPRASTPFRSDMSRLGPRHVLALPLVSCASCAVSWRMLGRIAVLLRAMSQPIS